MKIVLMVECEESKYDLELVKSYYSIGREQACDIVLPYDFISRRAALLILNTQPLGYLIRDGELFGIGSKHGIRINGQRATRQQLNNKDIITFHSKIDFVKLTYLSNYEIADLPTAEFENI